MIRRDDGNDWLLIAQADHAHLSGQVAAVWGNEAVPPLPVPDLLVPAIRDHDEGWRDWECAPKVDVGTGRPVQFTEMPMAESTAIWSRSIAFCGRGSPLGGIWVSRHFCWLAEQAQQNRTDPDDLAAIEAFLNQQEPLQRQWREEASAALDEEQVEELIRNGFRFVQFFDRLSLWLCCAPRSEPYEIGFPVDQSLRLIPETPSDIKIAPWPLSIDRLELTVPVRRLLARPYTDDTDLRSTLTAAPLETLHWRLLP